MGGYTGTHMHTILVSPKADYKMMFKYIYWRNLKCYHKNTLFIGKIVSL